MSKKRKNPFGDNNNHPPILPEPADNMSLEELEGGFRKLEQFLGKKKFERLLKQSLRNVLEEHGPDAWLDDYDVFDEEEFEDQDEVNEPVTAREWSLTHPANLTCGSDPYYADLANEIANLVETHKMLINDLSRFAREVGRVLAAYLEDLVSGTKIFSAMRRVCKARYGYLLPFYDCTHVDYMPDHLNEEDIKFLIWKVFCQIGHEDNRVYSPLAPGWIILADKIFDLLNKRYEEAPEAQRVTHWLERALRTEDYIEIRAVAIWLVYHNPLTYFPGLLDTELLLAQKSLQDERIQGLNLTQKMYAATTLGAWQRSMSPMGCPSQSLVGAVAKELGYEEVAKEIEQIQVLPRQIYALSKDPKSGKIFFETSDHVKLQVDPDSFASGFRPDVIGYAACILMKFKGNYHLNGILSGNPDLKLQWETQIPYSAYEKEEAEALEWLEKLDGKQVVCVGKLSTFVKKMNLPEGMIEEEPEAKDYIILISREMGMAVLPDMGYAFAIPGNRFYRKRKAAEYAFSDLICNNAIPHDVAMYIQTHHLLPDACIGASQGKEVGRRIITDYIAFWIGFYCSLPPYGMAFEFE